MVLVVTALAAVLVSSCGGGEEGKNEEEESQAPSQEEVQSALDRAVAAGIPGIAVEIRGPEGSEFLTAGSASLENEQPLTSEDTFRIASVTKAFTAAVVMELVEEGRCRSMIPWSSGHPAYTSRATRSPCATSSGTQAACPTTPRTRISARPSWRARTCRLSG